MTNLAGRARALFGAVPPKVMLAAKLLFVAATLLFTLSMVDWETLTRQSAWLLLAILGGICFALLFVPVVALRWCLLIKIGSTGRLHFLNALRGYFLGLFCNLALPGAIGGDLVRAHFASVRAQIAYTRSGLIVLTERLFGLLSIFLLVGIGVALNDQLSQFTPLPATDLIVGLVVVGAVLIGAMGVARHYIGIPLVFVPLLLLLSMIGQSTDFVLIHFYGRFLSVDVPLQTLLIVVPLVFIASILPFAPGGHGAREVTLTGLLAVAGIPVSQAALIALMLLTTKVGVGLASFGVFSHSKHLLPDDVASAQTK